MRSLFVAKAAAVATIALGTLGVAQAAHAHTDVYFSLGVPAPVYAAPEPVYVQPQPVYVAPGPVYVRPGYDNWRWRQDEWRREEWRREQWRREQWRHHRHHDRDDRD